MSASRGSTAHCRVRKPGRPRPLPPEVMARNLAIEKKRREALNEKFLDWLVEQSMQVLARLIPGLGTTQRLTKVLIVDESIRELERQQNLYVAAMRNIEDLLAENERLHMQVANLRFQNTNFHDSTNAGGLANNTPRSMDLYMDPEHNQVCEVGNTYNLMQSADTNHVGASVHTGYCPDVIAQSLQPSVQNARFQERFDQWQHYQTPLMSNEFAFDPYLDTLTSDGHIVEDCLLG